MGGNRTGSGCLLPGPALNLAGNPPSQLQRVRFRREHLLVFGQWMAGRRGEWEKRTEKRRAVGVLVSDFRVQLSPSEPS